MWIRLDVNQYCQHQRHKHLDDLRHQDHVTPVASVCEDPANHRQKQKRQFAEKAIQPQKKCRSGSRHHDDQPRLRYLLHPRADAGRKSPHPEEAEVAVRKCYRNPTGSGSKKVAQATASCLSRILDRSRAMFSPASPFLLNSPIFRPMN